MVERKVRMVFRSRGWKTIRAGASLGDVDIICVRGGRCLLLQIKSTKKKKFYYYGYSESVMEGFPYYVIVDFGYGKTRISTPRSIITADDGEDLEMFLEKYFGQYASEPTRSEQEKEHSGADQNKFK